MIYFVQPVLVISQRLLFCVPDTLKQREAREKHNLNKQRRNEHHTDERNEIRVTNNRLSQQTCLEMFLCKINRMDLASGMRLRLVKCVSRMRPVHSRILVYEMEEDLEEVEEKAGSIRPSNTTLSLRKVNKDCSNEEQTNNITQQPSCPIT